MVIGYLPRARFEKLDAHGAHFPPGVCGDESPQASPRMSLICYLLGEMMGMVQSPESRQRAKSPQTSDFKAMNGPHDSYTLLIISSGSSSSVPRPTLGHYKRMIFLRPG
jgi:hypothetical protein